MPFAYPLDQKDAERATIQNTLEYTSKFLKKMTGSNFSGVDMLRDYQRMLLRENRKNK